MKILHTISSLDIKYGGPPLSVYLLTKGLVQKNINTTLLTFIPSRSNTENTLNEKFIKTLGVSNYSRFSYTTELLKYLKKNNDFVLFHGQGFLQYPNHKMAMFARKIKKPYIISPRGMLEPWSLEHSKYIKRLAMLLYQKDDLIIQLSGVRINQRDRGRVSNVAGLLLEGLLENWHSLTNREKESLVTTSARRLRNSYISKLKGEYHTKEAAKEAVNEEIKFLKTALNL